MIVCMSHRLHQSDLFAPFLFLIAIEGVTISLTPNADQDGHLVGYQVRDGLKLHIFIFKHDTLFYGEGTSENL